jgi:Holliday junction resolvase RusA-like endonuclease
MTLRLTLPEPPSANRWWRRAGTTMHISKAAREYKADVALRCTVARTRPIPAPTPVAVRIAWYRGRKAGDLDKRLGVLLDALQGSAYESDAQVVAIDASRHEDRENPRVEVEVRAA